MNRAGHLTVCVPTRDRGDRIGPTLISLKALQHEDFDVVVVDQSSDDGTAATFATLVADDARFRYLASPTTGSSTARNVAASCATGSLIAFTDDDCVVPPDWLTSLQLIFAKHPQAGLVCAAVHKGEHDPTQGYVPIFYPPRFEVIRSPWVKWRARGIGANLAMRADALRDVGPFDEVLGAGGPLHSCEDGDIVYRFLKAGYGVVNAPEPAVIHQGFRNWSQAGVIWRRALFACGADCMKHLRLGDPAIIPTLLYIWFGRTAKWGDVLRLRRQSGVALFLEFARGLLSGLRQPLDRRTRTFAPAPPAGGSRDPGLTIDRARS